VLLGHTMRRSPQCWAVALSWLVLLLTGALAASTEAVEMLGEHEMEHATENSGRGRGAQELAHLKQSVAAAKTLVARAEQSGKHADAAIAAAAMKSVRFLTIRLEETIGEPPGPGQPATPKPDVDPMAHVRVDSRPKSTENTYPALGLTINAGEASGADAPADNILQSWGGTVSDEVAKISMEDKEARNSVWSQFGDLEKILKPGYGHGFGELHSRDQGKNAVRPDNQAELSSTLNDAKDLIAKSKQTLGIVTRAVNTVVKLDAEDASNARATKLEMKTPGNPSKGALWGGPEDEKIWDRIAHEDRQFKKKDGLLEYETPEHADDVQAQKDEEAQAEKDAEDEASQSENENDADRVEAAEQKLDNISTMRKETEQLKQMEEKKVEEDTAQKSEEQSTEDEAKFSEATEGMKAKQDAANTVKAAVEENQSRPASKLDTAPETPETELEKEKEKNMSLEEKTAAAEAPEDVQNKVNDMEKDESAKEESAEKAADAAEQATEEVQQMERAQTQQTADTETPSDEPEADAEAAAQKKGVKGGKGATPAADATPDTEEEPAPTSSGRGGKGAPAEEEPAPTSSGGKGGRGGSASATAAAEEEPASGGKGGKSVANVIQSLLLGAPAP